MTLDIKQQTIKSNYFSLMYLILFLSHKIQEVRLWCLTPISTIFQLFHGDRFLLVEKTTDLPQITDKLDHIMLYQVHLAISGILIHNFSHYTYKI